MPRILSLLAPAASQAVVILVVFGLMASPIAPALAQEAPPAETTPSDASTPGATADRDRDVGTAERPPITLQLPEQSGLDSETPRGREQDRGSTRDGTPPDDEEEFSTLSEEDPFPFSDERLSHEDRPKLEPDQNTGALRYEFPLTLPPGRNGLGPEFALVYDSSSSKNEYFGRSWSINIPYIERINRTGVENLYIDDYFFSSLDGELRATTTSAGPESFSIGSPTALFGIELPTKLDETSPDQATTTPLTGDERATAIIDAGVVGEYDYGAYRIDVRSVQRIPKGVRVFARAWRNNEPVGFGIDGSVEMERFNFVNPPVMVPDGTTREVWSEGLEDYVEVPNLKLDPKGKFQEMLAQTVALVGGEGTAVIAGTVGNTTSTFYPDGHPESTTMDGFTQLSSQATWDEVHDATSASAANDSSSSENYIQSRQRSDGTYDITRACNFFDTGSVIASSDTIQSATLAIYPTNIENTDNDGQDYVGVVQASSTFSSATGISSTDYDDIGDAIDDPEQGVEGLDFGSLSTSVYNNIPLNATGTSWIAKSGETKPAGFPSSEISAFCFREGHDIEDDPIASTNTRNLVIWDPAEASNPPKLVVTHFAEGTGPNQGDYGPLVENGDFRKYEFVDDEWWRVTDKFGIIYTFGEATTTRQNKEGEATTTYKWMLEEVRDLNDNYISYEYHKDNGQIYPDEITYTGSGSADGIFEVEFVRTYSPDVATTTNTGFPVKTDYKISGIWMKVDGTLVRKYDLAYANGFKSINLLLSSITESGVDELGATTTLPAHTFEYNDGFNPVWTLDTDYATSSINRFVATGSCAGDGIWKDLGVRPMDANGDGYADLVYGGQGSSKGVIVNDTDKGWDPPPNGWSQSGPFFVLTNSSDSGLRIMDADGDGMPDLVQSGMDGSTLLNDTYINTGSAFSAGLGSAYNTDPLFYYGVRFGDVNGDGLTDFIQADSPGRAVYTNRGDGTGWWEDENYDVPFDFPGLESRIADVNNDGLADVIISTNATSSTGVFINRGDGTGWDHDPNYVGVPAFEIDGVDQGFRVVDVTNDGYPDLVLSRTDATYPSGLRKVYYNKGDGTGWSDYGSVTIPLDFVNYGNDFGTRFADLTGDGILDLVQAVCDGNDIKGVYTNSGNFTDAINHPDYLTNITSATGEEIEVKYLTSPLYKTGGALHNPNLPLVLNTVRHIVRDDGFGNLATTTYEYGGGDYYFEDSRTRKFAGFSTTTMTDSAGNVTRTFFHQGNASLSSIGEHDDSFSKIGKPYRVEVYDSNDNLYKKTINKWVSVPQSNGRNYTQLAQTVYFAYDGDADHRDRAVTHTYDEYTGNLLLEVDYGEVTGSDDGSFADTGTDTRFATTTYAASTTPHVVGLPAHEQILDYASSTIRETKHYYDGLSLYAVDVGNETKTEFWKSETDYASTTRAFNSYGLVTSETDGENNTITYTYDSFNLYVATTTNALSQDTGYQYDYSLGKPKAVVDPNSNVFETVYDGLDRLVEERQPELSDPGTLVARKTYAYTDAQGARKIVETHHLDGSTSATRYVYLDGLDRTIQTRKEGESVNLFAVRDFIYNDLGLLEKESLPYYLSTGSSKTSPTATEELYTTYAYDPLRRISSVANSVGTTTNVYDQWTTTITDPLGNTKKLENDSFGRLATVVEHDSTTYATTTYAWNPDDTLATTTDADGNVRHFTYDGRDLRLTAEDLHDPADGTFGTWTYSYDDAGNLASFVDPKNQTVNFTYDALNRVLMADYTGQAGTEVEYGYDSCTEGVSRLCVATSTGAVTSYAYNALGLQATATTTIDGESYVTGYRYDRQGNLTNVIYPDGSEVQYTYNTAGLLETVEQKESGGSFAEVVSDFDYGPHDQVTYKVFGNGVESTYTYDADALYRLTNISTATTSMEEMSMGGGELLAGAFELHPLALAILDDLEQRAERMPQMLEETLPANRNGVVRPQRPLFPDNPLLDPPAPDEERPVDDQPDDAPEPDSPPTTEEPPVEEDPPLPEPEVPGLPEVPEIPATSTPSIIEKIEERTERRTPREGYEEPTEESPEPQLATAEVQDSMEVLLEGKTAAERADIKSEEIVKVFPVGEYDDATYGVAVEVQSIEKIDRGIELFARAWKEEEQLGFGSDGSVEWERFRIFNPPILVDDPDGEIIREWVDDSGELRRRTLREDLVAAVRQDLAHTISIVGKRGTTVVVGKRGNTTSTFYPDADPESTTVDGRIQNLQSTWDAVHDGTTGTLASDTDANGLWGSRKVSGSDWRINRAVFLFDTSAIDDGDSIDSATVSIDGNSASDDEEDAQAYLVIVDSTPASNTSISTDDFDQVGDATNDPIEGSGHIDVANFQIDAYTTFTLDATGLSWIDVTGITKLGGREGHDVEDVAPDVGRSLVEWKTADVSGTTADPKLIVEHSVGGGGGGSGGSGTLQNIDFTYDANGNITAITDNSDTGAGHAVTYTYDGLNRLVSASTTAASSTPYRHQFAYDMLGNILEFGTTTTSSTYAYGETGYANPHAVTGVGNGLATTTYAYDNNGNVTTIGSLDYTWDWQNRLASAERSGGGITSYGYDHTGQRVFKATGTATTSYPNKYYNLATTTGSATTTKHIFSPDGTLLATVEGSGVGTATTTYLHPDHLGGTNVTTDEDGEVTQTLDYYPYGSQRIANGPFSEQRRFIGEEFDGDTEFSYLNARYYQGSRGQFMSQDPVFILVGDQRAVKQLTGIELHKLLSDPQLLNSYAYARNNPLVLRDSQGEFIDVPWISNSPYFQESATAAYEQSAAWRFAFDHPYAASALVGLGATAAAGSGVQAYAAFHAAAYAGVGSAFVGGKLFAGSVYSLLTLSGLSSIPSSMRGFGQADLQNPSTIYPLLFSLTLNAASLGGGHFGAISDTIQFGTIGGQAAANLINNFRSSSVQTRADAVNSYNAAVGASSNESRLWTTPNGTVITWTGQIVSPAGGSN